MKKVKIMSQINRKWRLFILLLAFCLSTAMTKAQSMDWWKNAKFGLFLHWGLYSVTAGDWNGHPYKGNEHFMLYEKIPWKTYATIAKRFNPTKFNADQWVKCAKMAGMKYIVITAKHHDGFAMYNSPSSNYNIKEMTPWHKDPMKMLARACQKYDIKLCFYYSLGRDWQDPDVPTNWPVKAGRSNTWDYPDEDGKDLNKYFHRKVLPQVKELLTQYGPIGVLWFDTPELITKEQSQTLKSMIHSIQPDCIVNSRIGNGMGDFSVEEQKIGGKINLNPWESCVTMSGGWGYNKYDSIWKSPELLIRQLTETVSKGGNYLLNIGPKGDGSFPKQAVERLAKIGHWMNINGAAIYGTHPWKVSSEAIIKTNMTKQQAPVKNEKVEVDMLDAINDATSKAIFPEIRFTEKGTGNTARLFVIINSLAENHLTIKALSKRNFKQIKTVRLLSNEKINWQQHAAGLEVTLPPVKKGQINIRVLEVE
jgi:alpha-L-fucosidase